MKYGYQCPYRDVCPHCVTTGLQPIGEKQEQIQEDIVLQPETVVTAYQHDTAFCPTCRRAVFQTAEDELRNCQIGPTAKATAVFLRHKLKLSYRNVRQIFAHLFGLRFVPASAMAINLSVLDTARCRKLDPIAFLKTTFLSGYKAASALLFNDSS